MHSLDAVIFCDECSGSFFTYSRYSRYIISCISLQSLYIYKFFWSDTVLFYDIICQIIFYFSTCLFSFWNSYHDMLCCKLEQITVSGYHSDIHSLFFCLYRKSSKDVICLISFLFNYGDPHSLKHFFYKRNLLPELISHRFSCSLIFLKHFMAESRCMDIKSYRQVIRLFLF